MSEQEIKRRIKSILKKKALEGGANTGGDFSDFLKTAANVAGVAMKVAPLLGLGYTGGRRKKQPTQQLAAVRRRKVKAGSLLDDLPIVGNLASALGLGYTGAGRTGAGYTGGKQKKKRAPSEYAKFVKKFAAAHKGEYKGPELMKAAAAAWRSG